MGERPSSLLGRFTVKPKRHLAGTSSSSSRSAPSPVSTPEAETPTSFSGPSDYGLGYSSINHERSLTYVSKRTNTAVLPRPIELQRYSSEPSLTQIRPVRSRSRSANKLSIVHDDEEPLFVSIVDEAALKPAVQSTVRARSSSGSPPTTATIDVSQPHSPFAMATTNSHLFATSLPSRIVPRRCYSANDSEENRPSAPMATVQVEAAEASVSAFYAVARGWKKGVYTTKADADRQIRNFPGPLLQVFRDRAAAENFIAISGRFTPQPSNREDSEDEFIERTRIFNGLHPKSELARRRSTSMSIERKESQRRSRIHVAMHSSEAAAVNSPTLSLRSMFSDAPISPIDEINGFGVFPTPVPLQSMSLLPVKHLADSVAFYAKVLGFTCVSQISTVQAIMRSSSATVCLRTLDQAPPPPSGPSVSRMSLIRTSSIGRADALAKGRPQLPTMSEEHPDEEPSLPPTPESLSLSCAEPEPLDLPTTSLSLRSPTSSLSGTTVLIEYSGALEALHSLLSARLNEWRLDLNPPVQKPGTKGTQHGTDSARILSGVQQTPWNAQELHLCDLDGHRLIYTTPFL